MKEFVNNQIIPKIEKIIEPYLVAGRGNPVQNKYYTIDRIKHDALKNDQERELLTKLVDQANTLQFTMTIDDASAEYYFGVLGSLTKALTLITDNNLISCSGFFYTSQLQKKLQYEFELIRSAITNYETERKRNHAQAMERLSQVEKNHSDLLSKHTSETANAKEFAMKAAWYEKELELALADPDYLIGKTPAYFKSAAATPAHPHQKLIAGPTTPASGGQKSSNPGAIRGTLTSNVPQTNKEKDKAYLNEYFGALPTRILEILSCLSNFAELKDLALSAIEDRILNYENPASVELVSNLKNLVPINHAEKLNIDRALEELSKLISRDNMAETHKEIVDKLAKEENGRLVGAAVDKTANVHEVPAKYQIFVRIDTYLLPRPSKGFPWVQELLPKLSDQFINKLHVKMAETMNYQNDPAGEKKAKLINALNNQFKPKQVSSHALTMTK